MTENPLLSTVDLKKYFYQNRSLIDTILNRENKPIRALDGVSLSVSKNETIGVIGESGCGKTTLLMTLIGLHEPTDGKILFENGDTTQYNTKDWKKYRRRVQVIFQDPFNSLDPKMTVRSVLLEQLKIHGLGNRENRIHDILDKVKLNPSEKYVDRRPGQLSGGEMQRVSIARALIVEPDVILADEPVSMLDVSTQASILNLLSELISDTGVSMIYISHDLSTVSYICDKLHVMYLGRFVEKAPTDELLNDPKHPYSRALIDAIPIPDPHHERERTRIEGVPQDPVDLGSGCRFANRCPEVMDVCSIKPDLVEMNDDGAANRKVACHLHYDHDQ